MGNEWDLEGSRLVFHARSHKSLSTLDFIQFLSSTKAHSYGSGNKRHSLRCYLPRSFSKLFWVAFAKRSVSHFKEHSNLLSRLLWVFQAAFCFTFCPVFHSTRSGTHGSCVGGLFCRAFSCTRRSGKAVFSRVHPLFINPFHTASSHYACYCQWVSLYLAFIW